MTHFFSKIKTAIKTISWPKPKSIIMDTLITLSVTTILSLLIMFWTGGIEMVIDWIMKLF